MNINLELEFVNLRGETIRTDEDRAMTLREAAAESVASVAAGTPDKSLQRLKLARRIYNAPKDQPFEVTTEEASEIKTVIAQRYNPLIAGQAVEMIEGTQAIKEPGQGLTDDFRRSRT